MATPDKKPCNCKRLYKWGVAICLIVLAGYGLKVGLNNMSDRQPSPLSSQSNDNAQESHSNVAQPNQQKQSSNNLLQNLRLAEEPLYAGDFAFKDEDGHDRLLSQFSGKAILLNLWAFWCPPCRQEMPELAKLQAEMSDNSFNVMAINTDKAPTEKIQAFLQEAQANNLKLYRDSSGNIFNSLREKGLASGLPVTLLIDKDSRLIGAYNGPAQWNSDEAKTMIKTVFAAQDNAHQTEPEQATTPPTAPEAEKGDAHQTEPEQATTPPTAPEAEKGDAHQAEPEQATTPPTAPEAATSPNNPNGE